MDRTTVQNIKEKNKEVKNTTNELKVTDIQRACHQTAEYTSLINRDVKIINKILANGIQQHIKNYTLYIIPEMQCWSNIQNIMEHINKIQDKNHTIILLDAEKAFEKSPARLMIKILNKLGTERNLLHLIESIYQKKKIVLRQLNLNSLMQKN